MSRLLILLFGIVSTLAVLLLLILLYRYANENDAAVAPSFGVEKRLLEERTKPKPEHKWLEDLAAKKRPSYTYAVSEMELDLPLKRKPQPKTAYRLRLSHLDGYKMFCIRQVLERHGIDYSILRQGADGVLVVHDLDKPMLQRVVKLVRSYDVTIETENYTKD